MVNHPRPPADRLKPRTYGLRPFGSALNQRPDRQPLQRLYGVSVRVLALEGGGHTCLPAMRPVSSIR